MTATTESGRPAPEGARDAAERMGHDAIGAEHLVLSLLDDPRVGSTFSGHGTPIATARERALGRTPGPRRARGTARGAGPPGERQRRDGTTGAGRAAAAACPGLAGPAGTPGARSPSPARRSEKRRAQCRSCPSRCGRTSGCSAVSRTRWKGWCGARGGRFWSSSLRRSAWRVLHLSMGGGTADVSLSHLHT